MKEDTLVDLRKKVAIVADQEPQYFMYSDYRYCDEIYCEKEDCDDHTGSVLEYKFIIDKDGDYEGAIIVVGTGGPHIELNTSTGLIEGKWWHETYDINYDSDYCETVNSFWEDMFWSLMYKKINNKYGYNHHNHNNRIGSESLNYGHYGR